MIEDFFAADKVRGAPEEEYSPLFNIYPD